MTVEELHKAHFHELQTKRFHLRHLQLEDVEAMFAYTSVPENFRYLRRNPHVSAEEDLAFIQNVLEGYRQRREFVWGICTQKGKLIGTCRLFDLRPSEGRCEVSYMIHPAHQRQGAAAEAVGRLIQYAFEELGLQKVYARCAAENTGSERVMQKCGMTLKKTMPRHAKLHGVWHDFLLYKIEKGAAA